MKTLMGIAVLGCGRIGAVHAANIASMSGVRLTYVFDKIPALANKISRKVGVAVADSIKDIMQDDETQAVVICTPVDTHIELIKQGIVAGKAVFCEKPLAHSLKESIACRDFVAKHKGTLMIGFNRRFDNGNYLLKQKLNKRDLGQIEHIQITSRDPAAPPLSYLREAGGLFMDMTIHDFDLMLHLLDEPPVAISTMASAITDEAIGKAGDYDSALVSATTARGCTCAIHNSRRAVYGYDQRIEVFGSKGMLQTQNFHNDNLITATAKGFSESPLQHFFLERYNESFKTIMDTFARAVRGDKKAQEEAKATVIGGINTIYMAQQAALALKKKTTVKLSLPL